MYGGNPRGYCQTDHPMSTLTASTKGLTPRTTSRPIKHNTRNHARQGACATPHGAFVVGLALLGDWQASLLIFLKTVLKLSILASIAFGACAPAAVEAASACGYASHYGHGDGYHGRTTASGKRFNAYGLGIAHRHLPFGTKIFITNQSNGKTVQAPIVDRGPFVHGRVLDLSFATFAAIAPPSQGVTRVCYNIA